MNKSRIRLTDIPPEGKDFHWDRSSRELNEILQDLIQNENYEVRFHIRPVNSRDFFMSGSLRTQSPESCSLCAMDFKFPIQVKINEILIPHQPQERTSQYARVNHVSDAPDQGPQSLEYDENQHFDMGAYVHEAVALAIPFNPKPEAKPDGDCTLCELNQLTHNFGFEDTPKEEKPESPFAVLKNLKLQ